MASASEWQVSPRIARGLFWAPWVLSAALVLTRLNKSLFKLICDEDHIVEWGTFFSFVLACLVAGAAAFLFQNKGRKLPAMLYAGFALALFFAAGEEIAWGQRIADLDTPDELAEINKQDELTLHNIGDTLDVFKIIMTVVGLSGAIAYPVNQKLHVERYADLADQWMIPPFFLASFFFIVFAYRMFRYLVLRQSGFTITKYGEWPELCLAFGFFSFGALVLRRLVREPSTSSAFVEMSDTA